jgi:hypothetical protein
MAAGILMMKVTKATSAMPCPLPAGDDSLRLNLRVLTWEPELSTGLRARMATVRMRIWMRRKKHHKLMMDQCRMGRTDLRTNEVDGYDCEGDDDADRNLEEEALQADQGSTQNVED